MHPSIQAHLHTYRVSQNHIYTLYIRCFWQDNQQIYGYIRCIYTDLANPNIFYTHTVCYPVGSVLMTLDMNSAGAWQAAHAYARTGARGVLQVSSVRWCVRLEWVLLVCEMWVL
jgi:hypothetical protein